MIKVKFTNKGDVLTCKITGHAGSANIGKDLICASASMLAYTLAQAVTDMGKVGYLSEPPTIKINKGNGKIVCRANGEDNFSIALHTFLVIETGYKLLAHNYPQYVKLSMFGEA